MFVISLISRIGPVLQPPRRLFTRAPSLGWAVPWLAILGKACSRRFWVDVVRALPRKAGYVGGSLTPMVCLLVALTAAAIVIAGALSATSVGDELGRAVRVSWWFA